MFLNAKNERIEIENTSVDYISFGKGKKNLIIISEHIGKTTYIKPLARSFGHRMTLTLNSDAKSMQGMLERHWTG